MVRQFILFFLVISPLASELQPDKEDYKDDNRPVFLKLITLSVEHFVFACS